MSRENIYVIIVSQESYFTQIKHFMSYQSSIQLSSIIPKNFSLFIPIRLVEIKLEQAAKTLADANIQLKKEKDIAVNLNLKQKTQLNEFGRLTSEGLDTFQLENFRRYINWLVTEINNQNKNVAAAQAHVDDCRAAWYEARMQLKKYAALYNRYRMEESRKEYREQLKIEDEIAIKFWISQNQSCDEFTIQTNILGI